MLSVVKAGYSARYRICTGYAQLAKFQRDVVHVYMLQLSNCIELMAEWSVLNKCKIPAGRTSLKSGENVLNDS